MLMMRSDELGQWSIFEETRPPLRGVRVEFRMRKTGENNASAYGRAAAAPAKHFASPAPKSE